MMKYVMLIIIFFMGCSPSITKLDNNVRTFYITLDYERSFQKCVYFLSKESYLIVFADKSTGLITTGYKNIDPNRSLRLSFNLKKISDDSTRALVTIYKKNKGNDLVYQDQDQYRDIILAFTTDTYNN